MPRQAPPRHRPTEAGSQRLLALAATHHRAGRAAEAERLYRQILARDPGHVSTLMNLGALYRAAARPREAIALYERALARAGDHPGLRLNLGNALLDLEDWPAAERSLRQAVAARPQDLQAAMSLSRALLEQGRLDEAIALCRSIIAREPAAKPARRNLHLALQRAGRVAEAEEELRRLAAIDPDEPSARHLLAAAEGRTTAVAPADYVRSLFDGFAPHFEAKLQGQLGYRTPELLLALLRRHLPEAGRFAHVLDLGCGTGLMGPLLRPLADRLDGVDLSPRMLEAARAKGVYDGLAQGEIAAHVAGLAQSPDLVLDLVTAADVLVYVGDLEPLLRALAGRMAPGGLLLISTEAADGAGYRLLPTGRYAHAPAYVEAVGRGHGFLPVATETAVIRQDEGRPIMGGLHLLRRGPDAGEPLALAQALQAAGRLDEAAAACAAALAADPDRQAALRRLGDIERARGRAAAALDIWRRLLRQNPGEAALYRLAGEALASLHVFAEAAEHFARALELAPDDPQALLGLGAMLLQTGRGEAAVASLRRAALLAPRQPMVRFELARALALGGAMDEARPVLEEARSLGLAGDPLAYLEHLIERRDGGAATIASLQRIYDQAAPHYESHVIVGLDNRTWRLLVEILDADPVAAGRRGAGLELGCGPGQAGEELRRRLDRLTGLDLSPAMLEQARRRGAYDRLVAADIMTFLGDPAETEAYDLMFASDVLPHIGDFAALLAVAAARLRPGGSFLFSTEHSDAEDLVRLPEFRFRHSLAHVEQAATAAGLAMTAHAVSQIRVERGAPVMGGLYLLRRPG